MTLMLARLSNALFGSNEYVEMHKKDEDYWPDSIASWLDKYDPPKVRDLGTVNQMMDELFHLPTRHFTGLQVGDVRDNLKAIAQNDEYRQLIIEKFAESDRDDGIIESWRLCIDSLNLRKQVLSHRKQ